MKWGVTVSIYNVRLYDYENSQQIRIYQKPVIKNEKKEVEKTLKQDVEKKEKKSSDVRTTEQKERSQMSSANRTKQSIYEITRANNWEWFITLTFDREKIDSSNYDLLTKKVGKWLEHLRERKAKDLKYIIIPELHKDGKHYHFHGLLSDTGDMTFTDSGIVHEGNKVYNIANFGYGFSTATKVKDSAKASSYISKYITKDLLALTKGKRRYWTSKNLKKVTITEYNMSPEEIEEMLESVDNEITYMKTQSIPVAHQKINYIEVTKNENNM